MKKFIGLLLVVILGASLCACGESSHRNYVHIEESTFSTGESTDKETTPMTTNSVMIDDTTSDIEDIDIDSINFAEMTESDWNELALKIVKSWLTEGISEEMIFVDLILSEGSCFSQENYEYVCDNCKDVDWNEQALKVAQKYIDNGFMSKKFLADALYREELFTQEQAEHAVEICNADWKEEAAQFAKASIELGGISEKRLYTSLIDGTFFTEEEAKYAMEQIATTDWFEQAVQAAEYEIEYTNNQSRKDVIESLISKEFTLEQAEYAVDKLGLK